MSWKPREMLFKKRCAVSGVNNAARSSKLRTEQDLVALMELVFIECVCACVCVHVCMQDDEEKSCVYNSGRLALKRSERRWS